MVENKKNIYQRLSAFQNEVGSIVKDSVNPHFKNKYADVNTVLEAVIPALTKVGLIMVQKTIYKNDSQKYLNTQIINIDKPDELIESEILLMTNKQDMQGLGSAITYARRYSIVNLLCLGAEDDDGQRASQQPYSQPQRQNNPLPIKTITKEQVFQLESLIVETDTNREEFIKFLISKGFNIQNLDGIQMLSFKSVYDILNQKKQNLNKEG